MNNIPKIPLANPDGEMCKSCGIRPATKLCDFPSRMNYNGHPPKNLMYSKGDNLCLPFGEIACGIPICDKCALSVENIDICPLCLNDIQNAMNKEFISGGGYDLELSIKTAEWLVRRNMVNWACAEANVSAYDNPDVFGSATLERTVVCEIKVSRADFLKDAKKRIRQFVDKLNEINADAEVISLNPSAPMGRYRYFVTLGHIAEPDEIRPRWGLIEYRKGRFYKIKPAQSFDACSRLREGYYMIDVIRKHKYLQDSIFSTFSKESCYL